MDNLGGNKQSGQWRLALVAAMFMAVIISAMTAGATPPPNMPYTVTRWVEDWTYIAGEVLDIKLRIVVNNIDVSEVLYVHVNEMLSPSPEGWQLVALDDPSERARHEPPLVGNTHNFVINVQDDFPESFEFSYQVIVPTELTGLVRITAWPETEDQAGGRTPLVRVVTDLYPPGLPEIEDDGEAIDNYLRQLRQQGEEEGWDFEVTDTGVLTYDPDNLLGTDESFRPTDGERKTLIFPKIAPKSLPPKFDWRDTKPEVPIRYQGECGSCWAFALVSVAEKLVAIKDDVLVEFSQQWVLNCNVNNWNCNGGWNPYKMFIANDICEIPGLVLQVVLPYQGITMDCDCDNPRTNPYTFGYEGLINENQPLADKILEIKQAIQEFGPVWTTVYAGHAPFLAYAGGVFNYKPLKGSIDHAVVIEGWDDTRGNGVWIMRNSWGEMWGDKGYMLIEYDSSLIGSYTDVISYGGSPNGNITVTLEPQAAIDKGARWRVDGGEWLNSGATLPNIVPGEYTISYKDVEGFTTPGNEIVQLGERENITRTGTYVQIVVEEGEGEGEQEGEQEGEGESLPETSREIAEFLLHNFDDIDSGTIGKLTFEEIIAVLPNISQLQFDLLDANSDMYLTREELQAFLDGTPPPTACCGTCGKSGTWEQRVKRQLGDWLLVGATLLALAYMNAHRKTRE